MKKIFKIALIIECFAFIIGTMGWFFDRTPFLYNLLIGNGVMIVGIIIGFLYYELLKMIGIFEP